MKKTLLSIFGALAAGSVLAQTPSPSWQTLQNTSYTMTSGSSKFLDVVSSSVVWGVGYSGAAVSQNFCDFTRTINGGTSFTGGMIYSDTNTYVVANIDAVDANTCWVASYLKGPQAQGAVHKTTNGGTSWVNMTAVNMYTNTNSFTDIVAFLTPSVGITMGDPHSGNGNEFEIWRTTDAGATWTIVPGANIPNPTAGEYGLVNIYEKYGTTNLWFGTNKGRIFRSVDAGQTWNVSVLPGTPVASLNVNDIAFSSPLKGIAAVYNASTTPSVYEEYITSDGGVTWTQVTAVSALMGRNDVCGIPGTGVFASAANSTTSTSLSYSKDGGITWTDWGAVGIPYLAIDFADATSGWAATFQSAPSTGGIYKFNGPTSIFNLGNTVCLTGPSATTSPVNMSIGNAPVTYSWSSSAGAALSSATVSAPVITFTANGVYTITLLATNATTTSSSSQTVNVVGCSTPSPSFSAPTVSLCNNMALTFTNSSVGSPTPTYVWSTSPVTGVTISPSSSVTNPTITFATAGVYSVTLLATNLNGTAQVTQTINIANCSPTVNFTMPALTCTLSPFTPTASVTGNGPLSYAWTANPATGVSFSPNAFVLTPTISIVNSGTYSITLKGTNTSGSTTAVQTISISTCAGINENTNVLSSISIFPNPSTGVFNISNSLTNENINYTVSNILGAAVLSGKLNTIKNLDLSTQSRGIYFITFENNGTKLTKKIILE